jgi:hypothetical protein
MGAFVPDDFIVPLRLEHPRFILRQLLITDAAKDYDAVMSSAPRLKGVLDPQSLWPDNLTLEQNTIDLGWHHKEFQKRRSFAYTVMTHDERTCLGCVYIYPTTREGYDAEAFCWVRTSAFDEGLDPVLFNTLKTWLFEKWPFKKVAFPGRESK